MKQLALAVLLGSAFSMAHAGAALDARIWTYQYLLATSTTERELAPITEHIIKQPFLQVPEILDFAAEVLLARVSEADYPLQNKLRLVRVLAKEKSPRYNAVLTRVNEQAKKSELAKEARGAISKKKPAGPAYVPGAVDISAIVAEVDAAALAAKPTTEQGEHLAKFPGGDFGGLFDWAGKPHQVISGQTRITDGFIINVKIQRLTFFYRGLGRVVFGYSAADRAWQFQAVVADPLVFEQEFSYRERASQLGMPDAPTLEMMQLVSGYTASMKNVLEVNYRRQTRPLEFMDTAAEILATEFQSSSDPVRVDMYAWICRLLTMHGGQRYAAILKEVADKTDDPKLGRFARLPIEPTSEVPAQPYAPGTISLASQRVKYPVLYPQSTFQAGRL
ncbi:MAG: hypothetical protein ABI821_05485 [Pseudomonadota bacterium]